MRSIPWRAGCALALSWLVCLPDMAAAHLVTTGLGPFFDGFGHLFLTLEDLLPALALALYAGQRGRAEGRAVLFLLPGAWLVGGGIGLVSGLALPPAFAAVSFLLCGGLVALDAQASLRWVRGLAVGLGLVHGMMNGVAMAAVDLGWRGLLGAVTGLFITAALASALVVSLARPWTRVAVRVAGSWVVATGLLLMGWSLRR